MNIKIEESWNKVLKDEFQKEYFIQLSKFVHKSYREQICFPPFQNIFHAFDKCPFKDVKVVILGQDPYFNPGQAHGLCFSVNKGVRTPPSLKNILKELYNDIGIPVTENGSLERWASQGILLLNATLTVESGKAGSHQNKGWEHFTDAVIHKLNAHRENIVYFLWGSYAQKKGVIINKENNFILKAPHPSPLSAHRGFFGNNHFSKANKYLIENGKTPIDWDINKN